MAKKRRKQNKKPHQRQQGPLPGARLRKYGLFLLVPLVLLVSVTVFSWVSGRGYSYPQLPGPVLAQSLQGAERAMAGNVARADVIFMVTQGTLLTDRELQPPMRLLPETVQRRDESQLHGAEYKLWQMRHRLLPTLKQRRTVRRERNLTGPNERDSEKQVFNHALTMMVDALDCGGHRSPWAYVGEPGYG